MPELMLMYRAASFFGRLYAPEVLMGMHSVEEIQDAEVIATSTPPAATKKANKEAERLTLLINDAETIEDLMALKPHVAPENGELMETFNTKLKTLKP
jgi:hypothetical protein